jgi:hypothetical protein
MNIVKNNPEKKWGRLKVTWPNHQRTTFNTNLDYKPLLQTFIQSNLMTVAELVL